MKKIAITGGKGGTGKSTFSIILTNRLLRENKKVFLVDLDVECPNDYLLIGEKIENPKAYTYAKFPELDKNKCQKCGICAKVCRENAIFQIKDKYPVFDLDLCNGCSLCAIECPYGAISLKKKKTGKIFVNKIKDNFSLITGKSNPGLEETGPVVRQVKNFVSSLAKEEKPDIILFDTAAGTHCPVVNALMGADLAYLVTEPTPMGAYDLDLILNLCNKLNVPVQVVLNQANLGDKSKINQVLKREKLNIFEEILYSKKIAKKYSKGKLLNI